MDVDAIIARVAEQLRAVPTVVLGAAGTHSATADIDIGSYEHDAASLVGVRC